MPLELTFPVRRFICRLAVGLSVWGLGCDSASTPLAGEKSTTEDTDGRCANGRDDDGDGFVDCDDTDCRLTVTVTVCRQAEVTQVLCGDGFDNDADGATDCADLDCAAFCS